MHELCEAIATQLNHYPQVQVAYLFGSQARGRAGPLSDVDVAVLLGENLNQAEALDLQLRLMADLADALGSDDVDVVVLNHASLVLRHQVLKSGQILLCRDETTRFRFTYETNRDYLDAVPMYELHRTYQRRRIKEGKFGDRRGDYTAALAAARRVFGQAEEGLPAG
jgi:predicted nucleotidyltransferase